MIAEELLAKTVCFFVYTLQGGHLTAGTVPHPFLAYSDSQTLHDYFSQHKEAILNVAALDQHHPLRRLLRSYHVEVAAPLVRADDIIGFLLVGAHKTRPYSHRRIQHIKRIADKLTAAIQNARAVQQIKDLNANLEQRIDAATKELRASNAQLQKLDEAKDEFISMASHQLRTPLTSIKGYISMLMEGDVGKVSDEQKHLLQEAFVSSERMVRLIGDFLNVSRLQTGKFIIEKHPVDVAQIVQRELEVLEPNASSRGLAFIYQKPKKLPFLLLDENKFQQVIMNFADNAIYYSKEKAAIKVSLKVVGGSVEFTVKDNGIGVPVEQQDQLFNKFFRATNARQQRPDGTGVGLFLAKKVIDAHGGEIIFSSKENKGSTFGFRLPIEPLRAGGDADELGNQPNHR